MATIDVNGVALGIEFFGGAGAPLALRRISNQANLPSKRSPRSLVETRQLP
jgi:hypothetical protein